ncbi:unnamed protein product [Peniophora sp. CBMAI 1063]|nr:unnamed protein product [Peniophora sp. CBMAI 1063]
MTNSTVIQEAAQLSVASKVPLFTSVASLTWTLYDYVCTLEDEVRYVWPSRWNIGKVLFFWNRYYTILLVAFDTAQIHSFSKFQPSLFDCVLVDVLTRVFGVLGLWPIEIIMQLRIYALFNRSKRIAMFNAILFIASIVAFCVILAHNVGELSAKISFAKALPIPSCPIVHVQLEWAQWVPPTAYEGVLFSFTLWRAYSVVASKLREPGGHSVGKRAAATPTLHALLVQDNLLYFLGICGLLIFNNVMSTSASRVPWFSFGPFHAAGGIMTARMLIHLRKTLALRQQKTYNAALAQLDKAHPAQFSQGLGSPAVGTARAHRRADTESTLVDDRAAGEKTDGVAMFLVKHHKSLS